MSSVATSPGRPKDPEKHSAILEAAKKLFPVNGFDGTSMDAIAAEAGVSKLTVYSHFQDKESLFVEAVRVNCNELLPDELFLPRVDGPIRDVLLHIGRSFFALVSSEAAMNLHRMVLTDTRNPGRLGRMFWEAGPARITEGFAGFLRRAVDAGQLDIPDIDLAASHFLCLLKGAVNVRMLFGPCDASLESEADESYIHGVIDFFLRAYAPRP